MIQGGFLGGFGWWSDVCNLKNGLPSLGCHSILIRVLPFAFFSCALTVNIIGLSFLATVFFQASVFNGDLNQWDVAKVTNMRGSKLIRIRTNALTRRELMLL